MLRSGPALYWGILPPWVILTTAGTILCPCQKEAEKGLGPGVPSPDGNERVGNMLLG